MRIYQVGGAVRDSLLGYPVHEHDWVVVGATPDALLQQGFLPVGKDFPVFLHPKTKEEYALARTERKTGDGYYGFSCHFSPDVSLEEDLLRRDLTINAMARDEQGQLIDPYGGQQDLLTRTLRHVSPAFIEDPVRVLRVARFAARYHHLGFRLANETRCLMVDMVRRGELNHLVPERVWQEWQRSLGERNPEQFIWILRACGALKVILPELDALFGVPNPKHYHLEIDSGVHTLMVLQAACQLSKDPLVRFAALLHDLGKAKSPMAKWPKHHGHELAGVPLVEALCTRLRIPADYRDLAKVVAREHLNIHRVKEMKAATLVKLLEHCDAYRRPDWFGKILLACQADAEGCGKEIDYTQADLWRKYLQATQQISGKLFADQGLTGSAIKTALHDQRVAILRQMKGEE